VSRAEVDPIGVGLNVGVSMLTLFPGRVGGSESYVRGLLREFDRLDVSERITVLANRHVLSAYGGATGRVSIHHVRSYRAGDRMATRALAMAFARLAPRRVARDVPTGLNVIHYPVTVAIPATTLPTVVTSHELLHHVLPGFLSPAERTYRRLTYDRAIRGADVVVALSDHLRETIVARLGVPRERIEVVRLGIDRARFSPDGESGYPAGLPDRFIFYPANLWPHKNHERLLRAFALCRERDIELVLAGQSYGRLNALMEQARSAGVLDRVRHLGHVPSELLPGIYRAARAVVFPSLYENFGFPPLEAMACGCPVASSTAGALGEICGDAVVTFDPTRPEAIAAAIEAVTEDDGLRSRLRERGFERVGAFDWTVAAARHIEIYLRAATGRVRRVA
jgi:glycosyltransferase involved in cell wall biosynthesis